MPGDMHEESTRISFRAPIAVANFVAMSKRSACACRRKGGEKGCLISVQGINNVMMYIRLMSFTP
eukprot:16432866-Heterocapsa_arctica.AAC.1